MDSGIMLNLNTDTHAMKRAVRDITRCIVCMRRYDSDDVRENVYKDSEWIGTIHDTCYEGLLGLSDSTFGSMPVLAPTNE